MVSPARTPHYCGNGRESFSGSLFEWARPSFPDQRLPQRRKVTIDVGTLVVDMYDTAEKELIWSGSVTKTIDLNSSPGDRQKNLDRAATKLLTNFPPK